MGRSIYIDFGANAGDTIAAHLASTRVDHCWGFEPNPTLAQALRERFAAQAVEIVEMAAWIGSGILPLYLGHPLSSTIVSGKVALENHPQYAIGYKRSVDVATVDTATWLYGHVRRDDTVTVKMDIEGAEYPVLRRLLETGAIDLIDELRCEFHAERFPAYQAVHEQLVEDVASRTRLIMWR